MMRSGEEHGGPFRMISNGRLRHMNCPLQIRHVSTGRKDMQRCPRCGAPNSAPTCWHCGQQAAIDGVVQPAIDSTSFLEESTFAEESTEAVAPAAVPDPRPIEAPPASTRRGISSRLLIGASAAVAVIALLFVFAAGSLSRPAAEVVTVGQAEPVRVAATAAAPPAAVEMVELSPMPTWVGRRQATWGYDGSKTITFALDAITDVTASTSRSRPQLVTRCLSRAIEVYVVTGPLSFERQTGTHTVRVRLDDDPEQTQQWADSEGSHELFAPEAGALVDRLAQARRLRVGFTPFNAKPVTAEFILDGFDQLAPLVTRTCGRRLVR